MNRLGRSIALALLLATGSGCATTRQGIGSTIAVLGATTLAVAFDADSPASQSVAAAEQDTRMALLFTGATAVLVGSVIALAPSRRHPRPAPVTAPAPASAPAPAVAPGPIAPDAPAPDAPGVRGECPPQAVCLPMAP